MHKKKDNKDCCMKNCGSLFSFLLVVLWMAVIFSFSAEPASDSSALSQGVSVQILRRLQMVVPQIITEQNFWTIAEFIEGPIRKMAHFTEYALLGFLLSIHIASLKKIKRRIPFLHKKWLPAVIGCLYAMSDEFHQLFVPGRSGRLFDVGVDTAGAAFGTLIFYLLFFIIKKMGGRE